jgi:hypothetical protein
MFHDHSDYVGATVRTLRTTQDRHERTAFRDDLETTTRLYFFKFAYTREKGYGSIHTGWYVGGI